MKHLPPLSLQGIDPGTEAPLHRALMRSPPLSLALFLSLSSSASSSSKGVHRPVDTRWNAWLSALCVARQYESQGTPDPLSVSPSYVLVIFVLPSFLPLLPCHSHSVHSHSFFAPHVACLIDRDLERFCGTFRGGCTPMPRNATAVVELGIEQTHVVDATK